MKKKYYNEDEKYQEVIQSLKNLPMVEAPSDFEFTLKRKLHNLHAEKTKTIIPRFSFSRIFVPATALALTSVILFFVFFNQQSSENENPLMAQPLERQDYYDKSVNEEKIDLLIDPVNISSNDVVIKKEAVSSPQQLSRKSSSEKTNEQSVTEDEFRRRRLQEFLASGDINSVDQSLKARPQTASSGRYQSGRTVNFDGFNLINEENDRMLYELKARMDSLKKWMRENR